MLPATGPGPRKNKILMSLSTNNVFNSEGKTHNSTKTFYYCNSNGKAYDFENTLYIPKRKRPARPVFPQIPKGKIVFGWSRTSNLRRNHEASDLPDLEPVFFIQEMQRPLYLLDPPPPSGGDLVAPPNSPPGFPRGGGPHRAALSTSPLLQGLVGRWATCAGGMLWSKSTRTMHRA